MGLIDVVNFNADASCLAAHVWLEALAGGEQSRLCRWLSLYPELGQKVTLGIMGSALAEMRHFNPESIALIARHPQFFELVLRPFSHDVALLRTRAGFLRNLHFGRRALELTGLTATPCYLPPEFMLTAEQVSLLEADGVAGVFVNRARFREDVGARIPTVPYTMVGAMGGILRALPIEGALTLAYLASMWAYSATPWNEALAPDVHEALHLSWRDGETAFLAADGLERERVWLQGQARTPRLFLRDALHGLNFLSPAELPERCFRSYPPHSFAPWTRELRMFGFLQRIRSVEERLDQLPLVGQALWLQAINSDVLSAVEKEPPVIQARPTPDAEAATLTLFRSERGFEGEELLVLLEQGCESPAVERYIAESDAPHIVRLRARLAFLREA